MRGEVAHMLRDRQNDARYKKPLHVAAKGGHADVVRFVLIPFSAASFRFYIFKFHVNHNEGYRPKASLYFYSLVLEFFLCSSISI